MPRPHTLPPIEATAVKTRMWSGPVLDTSKWSEPSMPRAWAISSKLVCQSRLGPSTEASSILPATSRSTMRRVGSMPCWR